MLRGRENGIVPRQNNFDLLRLILSALVLLAHAQLVGFNLALPEALSGNVAVQGFFVISGFLIVKSCHESSSIGRYFAKRARRIYPAYAAVILTSAVAGFFVTELTSHEYLSLDLAKYLAANLVFLNTLHPSLPGVFLHNTTTIVNGSLWTLKIEVMFYIAVPLLVALLRGRARLPVIVAIYVGALLWFNGFMALADRPGFEQLSRQLPGQMSFFICGAAFYYYYDFFNSHAGKFLLGTPLCFAIDHLTGLTLLGPIGIATIVIYAGALAPYVGNAARFGDLSYGLYIVHFPIYQLIAATGFHGASPGGLVLLALAWSLGLALLSWHFVERPMLHQGSHYRVSAVASTFAVTSKQTWWLARIAGAIVRPAWNYAASSVLTWRAKTK
jgi:peptidoglycan/LPS O-acetylase OafA/YrhL